MSGLLPCPFCGHDDQLYPAHHFPGTGPAFAIDCLRCGIDFTPREGMDVADAWNRRASQAEIERLKACIADLAEAARNACNAAQHTPLVEALFEADRALTGSKE